MTETKKQADLVAPETTTLNSSMVDTGAPFTPELLEFARTESDPDLLKKKIFGITGKTATMQEVAQLKAHLAAENRELSLASFAGDISDYHKRAIVDQFEMVSYLKSRAITGDDEALKYYDKNIGVLERLVNQKADTQVNVQNNYDISHIQELINASS